MGLFGKPDIEKLKAKKDVKALIKILTNTKYNEDSLIREKAIEALGETGNAAAAEPLLLALKDKDRHIRAKATRGLKRIGKVALKPLIQALKDKDSDIRRGAIEVLGEIGDAEAVEPLIQSLKDKNKDVRRKAAMALGEIGDARGAEPLFQAMKDTDISIQLEAAVALGKTGDVRALEPLIQALKEGDITVRTKVTRGLKRIGKVALKPLIQALKDKDSDIRWRAIEALGEIGDAEAVEPLIQSLKDKNKDVRATAAMALGEISDARGVEPLIQALKDKEEVVRTKAEKALGKGKEKGLKKAVEFLGRETDKVAQEVDRLVDELAKIGLNEGFLTTSDGRICGSCGSDMVRKEQITECVHCGLVQNRDHFDQKNRHKRTRKIGERLNEVGNIKLMQTVCSEIRNELGQTKGRELEAAWAYIGSWLP